MNKDYGAKELDLCEFGIDEEKCYFCGQPRTVRFSEHWIFCPNCSAMYTFMIIVESNCDHIKDNIPYVIKEPWYNKMKHEKPYAHDTEDLKMQICSVCGKECVMDGW